MSQIVFFAALVALLGAAFAISMLWQRSRGLAAALAAGLLLCALAFFLQGRHAAPSAPSAPVATKQSPADVAAELERRVARDPKDVRSLVQLARTYVAMEKFDLARDTYARAAKLKPEDTDLSVEYVAALMRASSDQRFPPFAVTLLEKAVAKNPRNQQALFFLGLYQMQSHQWAQAAETLGRMEPVLEPSAARELRLQLEVARMRAGLPPLPAAVLTVEVGVDPAFAGDVHKGDILYVYARALSPGGPPVAVKRVAIESLPAVLHLSDDDSPLPTEGLSAQFKVVLQARLSRTGDVRELSGDLESAPVEVATTHAEQISLGLVHKVP